MQKICPLQHLQYLITNYIPTKPCDQLYCQSVHANQATRGMLNLYLDNLRLMAKPSALVVSTPMTKECAKSMLDTMKPLPIDWDLISILPRET